MRAVTCRPIHAAIPTVSWPHARMARGVGVIAGTV